MIDLLIAFVIGLTVGLALLGSGAISIYKKGKTAGHEEGMAKGMKRGIAIERQKHTGPQTVATTIRVIDPDILLHALRVPNSQQAARRCCQ